MKIDVNNNFKAVIAKNMTENGYCKGFAINGFTKCKLKHNYEYVVYHANLNVYGEEWYDFCIVDFDDDVCPAHIHGFLSGLATNVLLGDGKSVAEIATSIEHNYSMYVVIHAAKNILTIQKLRITSSHHFSLEGMKIIIT